MIRDADISDSFLDGVGQCYKGDHSRSLRITGMFSLHRSDQQV
jgi:hypothetical protein